MFSGCGDLRDTALALCPMETVLAFYNKHCTPRNPSTCHENNSRRETSDKKPCTLEWFHYNWDQTCAGGGSKWHLMSQKDRRAARKMADLTAGM